VVLLQPECGLSTSASNESLNICSFQWLFNKTAFLDLWKMFGNCYLLCKQFSIPIKSAQNIHVVTLWSFCSHFFLQLLWNLSWLKHPTFYLQMERIGRVSWVHDVGWLNASPDNILCRANVTLDTWQSFDLEWTYARLDFLLHHYYFVSRRSSILH
jgi:hypothetical protein